MATRWRLSCLYLKKNCRSGASLPRLRRTHAAFSVLKRMFNASTASENAIAK